MYKRNMAAIRARNVARTAQKKAMGKLQEVSFRKMAPNIVTLMALCSGITAIRYAIIGKWTAAILCLFWQVFLMV